MSNKLTFETIQNELNVWTKYNFPNSTSNQQFLGMVEEVGELSHALLKQEQGIRGTKEEHEEKIRDSLGDLLIYTLNFCNSKGYNLNEILEETWNHVKNRDWVKYKIDGRTQ